MAVDQTTDPVGALIETVREHILDWRRPGSGYRLITDEIQAHELAREIVDVMWEWEPPPRHDWGDTSTSCVEGQHGPCLMSGCACACHHKESR